MQTLENDYDDTSERLLVANNNLVEKDKALSNVSWFGSRLSRLWPGLGSVGGVWRLEPAVGGLHDVVWSLESRQE